MIKTFNETRTIDTKRDLKLHLESGNVGFVVQGYDKEETSIDVSLELKGDIQENLTLDDILTVDHNKKKNELSIELSLPDRIHASKSHVEILVPYKTTIESHISNGGLSLEELIGNHDLESSNGSIKVHNNQGTLSCKTKNGSLKIEECNGDIEASTKNGSITIRTSEGRMNIDGENGPCKISRCKGTLALNLENGQIRIIEGGFKNAELKNKNGSMYYEFLPIEQGKFSFNNKNGKILLIIPEEIEFTLQAENHLGNIRIGLDGEYDRHKTDDGQTIKMIKGSGNVKIDVKNKMGSIQLMKDPIQKDVNMDFSSFGDNIADIFDQLPIDECMKKSKKAFKKIKKSFKNMNFDFSDKFQIAMDNLEKNKDKIKAKIDEEIKDKKHAEELKKNFKETLETVKEAFQKRGEQKESMSESRMKILDMLEKGTISADEAERLLKALGEDDE